MTPLEQLATAARHHQAGDLTAAEAIYRRLLQDYPTHADVLHLLGVIHYQRGDHAQAEKLIRQAVQINPANADYHGNLALALAAMGKFDRAIESSKSAIKLKPDFAKFHSDLASALIKSGQLALAADALQHAANLNPDPSSFRNLGTILTQCGSIDRAIRAFEKLVALNPNDAESLNLLATALKDTGQLDQAIATYQKALAINPNSSQLHGNLANALKDAGRLDKSITESRKAIKLDPEDHNAHSNLIYTLHYHPSRSAKAIAKELARWNERHARPLSKSIRPHTNDRTPDRRLRIGYVSADFRAHPVGGFLVPLLSNHDKSKFEIFAYANVPAPDAMTHRLKSYVDTWRRIWGLPDAQVADLIREDQIDILVDLSLHSGGNRLLVFARKPAPVQVTYLAYCSSSGLETMDYRLSDPYLDPPGMDESVYTEKTIRLPRTFWCYQPPIQETEPSELPATMAGKITFGCLNNFCKINNGLLDVWSEILRAIPDSQIRLSAREGSHRQRVVRRLKQSGIDPQRVRFAARQPLLEYFKLYEQIDIALDTFPYCGGTTTCDALSMGVPVVTLAGQTAVGRAGVSILSNIGLPELIADSPAKYVQLTVNLARDLTRLQQIRRSLRRQMQQSPLTNAPQFARDIEAIYRQIWQPWCVRLIGAI